MKSEQAKELLDIYNFVTNDINTHHFSENEDAYILSNKWYARYKRAGKQNKLQDFTIPINNSHLYDQNSQLKQSICYNRDFLLISKNAYDNLLKVYKFESPAETIKFISNPEESSNKQIIPDIHPLKFTVQYITGNSDNSNISKTIINISRYNTVSQLKLKCVEAFKLNQDKSIQNNFLLSNTRLYDYFLSAIREVLDDSRTLFSYNFPCEAELIFTFKNKDAPSNEFQRNVPRYNTSPGLVGLKKFVNSSKIAYLCYQASTTQALAHCEPLYNYIFSDSCNSNKSILVQFQDIFKKIWTTQNGLPIDQSKLNEEIGQKKRRFLQKEQQDAQDFLETLLDYIIGQTCSDPSIESIQQIQLDESNGTQIEDQRISESNWSKLIQKNDSPLYQMFYGLQSERFECGKCKNVKTIFAPSCMIPIHKDVLAHKQRELIYIPYNCDDTIHPKRITLKVNSDFVKELSNHGISFNANASTILFAYLNDNNELIFVNDQNYEGNQPLLAFEVPDKKKNYFIAKFELFLISQNVITFFLCMFGDTINDNEAKRIAEDRLKQNLYKEPKIAEVNSDQNQFFTNVTVSGTFQQNDKFEFMYDYVVNASVLSEKCDYSKQEIIVDNQKPHFDITDVLNESIKQQYFVNKICNKCNENTEQMISTQFWKLPEILIFHIISSRFSSQDHIIDQNELLNVELDYPDTLDMTEFVESSQSANGMKYKLFAVTVRLGQTIDFGHYYTFALHHQDKGWWKFDDENVTSVSQKSVHSRNAYLLYYQRVKDE